jgi:hypothetical protein
MASAVEQWLRAHAYAPDDIVLGHGAVLDDAAYRDLWALLDAAEPGWRVLFEDDRPRMGDHDGQP